MTGMWIGFGIGAAVGVATCVNASGTTRIYSGGPIR